MAVTLAHSSRLLHMILMLFFFQLLRKGLSRWWNEQLLAADSTKGVKWKSFKQKAIIQNIYTSICEWLTKYATEMDGRQHKHVTQLLLLLS